MGGIGLRIVASYSMKAASSKAAKVLLTRDMQGQQFYMLRPPSLFGELSIGVSH